jgi:hypothetical protein
MVSDGIRVLAVVVGVTIALLAVVPVAVLYLSLRLVRWRLKKLRHPSLRAVDRTAVHHGAGNEDIEAANQ